MAKMIDQKPSFHGEATVWEAFKEYLPDSFVVYNNREINGREFDCCVLMENAGVLIIEVKGWLADKIKVRGVDIIDVEGYDKPQRSPKKQARAYRFELLNRFTKKYNASPLVFDMVCYPFISREEYLAAKLDIVSEEKYTLFKEDLEDRQALIEKIQNAYYSYRIIPHTEMDSALFMRIRRDWEPDLHENEYISADDVTSYSELWAIPGVQSDDERKELVDAYFSGTKEYIFVGNAETYSLLCKAFDDRYKERNIQPSTNRLNLGYENGLKIGERSTRSFNLEIYYVEDLAGFISSPVVIEEGVYDTSQKTLIEHLASSTSFNLQQFGVEHASAEKNTLVEAGAGTGKTYAMVSRVAFLCNKKSDAVSNLAEEVAMVTFTNDAANNMKARLKQMFLNYYMLTSNPRYLQFVEDTDRAHISTIHSFALEILRGEVLYSGLGTKFRISSNEYLRSQIYNRYLSDFLAEMEESNPNLMNEIPVPIYELQKKIMDVADRLLAKSVNLESIRPSEMGSTVDNTIPYFNELIEKVIIPAENDYSLETHLTNALDLKESIILLEKVLSQLQGKLNALKLKYMFVDEFQDTDDVQIQVFQKLQKAINAECRLFVVGDLKQSIYRFRGATLSAFEQLMKSTLFEWEVHNLAINYRTDYRLLDKYSVIFAGMGEHKYLPYSDKDRLTSNVVTDLPDNELLVAIPCSAKDEKIFADTLTGILMEQKSSLEKILAKRKENHLDPLSKAERTIAVLVRSNWQVRKVVEIAKKRGIRVETKSEGNLFQLEPTLDLYKLLLAMTNPSNPVYLVNFMESNYANLTLDYQKYHGSTEQERISDLSRILDEFFELHMGKSWQQVISEAYTQPVLFVLKHLYDALQPWVQYSRYISEQRYYTANYEFLLERIIKYLRADALSLNQVLDYLQINILTRQEQASRESYEETGNVQLICTTIHRSKGLEYGTVILPYTDEDISDPRRVKLDANYSESKLAYTVTFDSGIRERNSNFNQTVEVDEQIAEESRILYVALTRAIRNCVWINNVDKKASINWASMLED